MFKEIAGLTLATALTFTACGPKPTDTRIDPSPSALVSTDLISIPDKIDVSNFSKYFTSCESRAQLLKASEEQGKNFFPLSIGEPSDVIITFFRDQRSGESLIEVTVRKAILFISPVEGQIIPLSEATKSGKTLDSLPAYLVFAKSISADVNAQGNISQKDVNANVLAVQNGIMGKGPDKESVLIVEEGDYEKIRQEKDVVKRGDPLLKLTETLNPSKPVEFGLRIVPGAFSADLTKYATSNGKVLYCPPNKL